MIGERGEGRAKGWGGGGGGGARRGVSLMVPLASLFLCPFGGEEGEGGGGVSHMV